MVATQFLCNEGVTEESLILQKHFVNVCGEMRGRGWWYDPNADMFSEFLEGIDSMSDQVWFHYRPLKPCLALGSSRVTNLDEIQGLLEDLKPQERFKLQSGSSYTLRIVSPLTFKHKSAVDTFQRCLGRRYFGVFAKKLAFIFIGKQSDSIRSIEVKSTDVELAVEVIQFFASNGHEVNRTFSQAMDSDCELILLSEISADLNDLVIDSFIPFYPIVFTGALVFTGLHLLQINGCSNGCSTGAEIFQSLRERIAWNLGAVLVQHLAFVHDEWNDVSEPKSFHLDGLSSFREGILKDSRCIQISNQSSISSYVPQVRHGWCSDCTRAMLQAAIWFVRPQSVLELGSWYGLSAGLINRFSEKPLTFYAVDWFKNNAIYEHELQELTPPDKLFFNHLRFESFYRNLSRFSNVIMMKSEAREGIDLLKRSNISVDMIFVDCEKKTERLIELIRSLKTWLPNAIIVGDDFCFKSVKRAVNVLRKQFLIFEGSESFIILPDDARSYHLRDVRDHYDSIMKDINKSLREDKELADLVNKDGFEAYAKKAIESGKSLNARNTTCLSGSVVHEICRSRDKQVLSKVWEQVMDFDHWDSPLFNDACLSPFDYLSHKLLFE